MVVGVVVLATFATVDQVEGFAGGLNGISCDEAAPDLSGGLNGIIRDEAAPGLAGGLNGISCDVAALGWSPNHDC